MRIPVLSMLLCGVLAARAQQSFTLEQCIQRAEERNLAAINAALEAEVAGMERDRAYWDLLPSLNGVATHGYNYGRAIDRFTNTFANDRVRTNNFYLSGQVGLFEGMVKQNRIRQAGLDLEAAEKAREAILNDVRLEVTQAFLDVLGLRERIAAAGAQITATREQIARTEALVEGGRLPRAELLTLRAQLAQEELTLTDARNQHDQRLLALGRAMQLDMHETRGFDITAPAITAVRVMEPTVTPEEVLENVLRANPAYARAELDAQSAERGIAIARAGSVPSLLLNGSVGTGFSGRNLRQVGEPVLGSPVRFGTTASGEAVYAPNLTYSTELVPFSEQLDQNLNESIGLTLNVPLFNNMRNRNAIAQSRVRHEQARNRMATVRNDLQRNVLEAVTMQRAAFRQYEAADRAVEAGTLALEYAQERFTAGVITSMELGTAKAQLDRNVADRINAKYQYLMASKYMDVLQGLPVTL